MIMGWAATAGWKTGQIKEVRHESKPVSILGLCLVLMAAGRIPASVKPR